MLCFNFLASLAIHVRVQIELRMHERMCQPIIIIDINNNKYYNYIVI